MTATGPRDRRQSLAKDKKKKDKKSDKPSSLGAGFKALTDNPLIGEVVAAALVATASALKDSNRAKALASHAGDELEKLSKSGADRGSALWDMALQIGKRSLEAMTAEAAKPAKSKAKPAKSDKDDKGEAKPKSTKKKAGKVAPR